HPECPAERVSHDDSDVPSSHLAKPLAKLGSAAVAVLWQESHHLLSLHVRMVDAGVCTDESLACLDDEHPLVAQDPHALVQDCLDQARVAVQARAIVECSWSGLDVAQVENSPFGLGNHLLRDVEPGPAAFDYGSRL